MHPTLTTRAKTEDRLGAANLALEYLQLVLRHVGPAHDAVRDAVEFIGRAKSNRRGTTSRRRTKNENVSPTMDLGDDIESELADGGSLWAQADDFWQVLGWSFNCSVLHKYRWERWRAWLEIMIEMLEMDWEARIRGPENGELEQSIIVRYINSGTAIAGKERKILRAIFADGRSKAVAEFGEIWQHETKALKKDNGSRKAEAKIDIEADDYGDYMDEENDADLEDSESDSSSRSATSNDPSLDSTPNIAQSLGGMDSLNLRLRLLPLLSRVSAIVPDSFTSLNNLYHTFFEHIRPLPIPAFMAVMSPAGLRYFEPTAASTLTQYILRSIIAAAAPLPPNDNLSQDVLEASYLPFAANTNSMIDNAKVSLCVETLIRLLDKHVGLEWTTQLYEKAEAGIRARATKAKGKRKRGSEGSCDPTWLTCSADRIRMVVELAKP